MKTKPWGESFRIAWIAAATIIAPLQSAQGADSSQDGLLQVVQADLDHVAELSDRLTQKLVAQDGSVCEPGKDLDQLSQALNKMTADYAVVLGKIPAGAAQLYSHIEEDSKNADSMLAYFADAKLKSTCASASKGDSAKAMARMNITLQVTHDDAVEQSLKTVQLSHDAKNALNGLAKR